MSYSVTDQSPVSQSHHQCHLAWCRNAEVGSCVKTARGPNAEAVKLDWNHIYDLTNWELHMWLSVNESVWNLIWIRDIWNDKWRWHTPDGASCERQQIVCLPVEWMKGDSENRCPKALEQPANCKPHRCCRTKMETEKRRKHLITSDHQLFLLCFFLMVTWTHLSTSFKEPLWHHEVASVHIYTEWL